MRNRAAMAAGLLTVLAPWARADAPPPSVLPLTSVRLYETGVGYFARSGRLDGRALTLPVPASHLDDALKTLVVLSGDKESRVQGVEFSSSLSRGVARALAGLPPGDEAPLDLKALLISLKGAAVEVKAAAALTRGRLIDVSEVPGEVEPRAEAGSDGKAGVRCGEAPCVKPPPDLSLLLLTDKGELRRFAGRQVESVRPTEPSFAVRLHAALDALSTRAAQESHPIRLLGTSRGPVTLGYIAEAPLYRTSWRLVIDDGGAVLVGWALLHNDTDEDWKSVKVELVNGQPDSFLFPMAAPRYDRRPLAHPERELSTVPQLLSRTADSLWGDFLDEEGGGSGSGYGRGVGGLGLSGMGRGGGGSGSGTIGLGSVGTVGSGGDSDQLGTGNLAGVVPAQGVEGAALFTYTLPDPLDLRGHGSALVPFLQRGVEAVEVTLIGGNRDHPRTAVRFTNSTGQTLPAGPLAVFARGGFSGETGLDRLKPDERRFLEYGNDLDVHLEERKGEARDATRLVRVSRDQFEEHYLRESDITFTVENRSGRARRLLVQLECGKSATVKGADGFDWDSESSRPLALLTSAARTKADRRLTIVERLVRRTPLARVESARLRELIANKELAEEQRAALARALPLVLAREANAAQIAKVQKEQRDVEADLVRLRDDMKSVNAGSGSPGALVSRVASGEDRLVSLRKRLEELGAEDGRRGGEVETALRALPSPAGTATP